MPSKSTQSYFYLTRKDKRGSLFLLVFILLICMFPLLFPWVFNFKITDNHRFDSSLLSLKIKQAENSQNKTFSRQEKEYNPNFNTNPGSAGYIAKEKGTLFYFDPNTIEPEGWKKLGLRDKTITTILNFRSKGGKFREPEDIKKIWGLFPDEAERLIPFIRISVPEKTVEPERNRYTEYTSGKTNSVHAGRMININGADTAAFIQLPGIGSKLSQRIINFREKLGGFYSINQIGEIFGLPDSVFQKIKPMLQISGEVKKININTATLDELKIHPYIKYPLANAIVQYRIQHGNYQSVTDIKKIMILDEQMFAKVSPYLNTN